MTLIYVALLCLFVNIINIELLTKNSNFQKVISSIETKSFSIHKRKRSNHSKFIFLIEFFKKKFDDSKSKIFSISQNSQNLLSLSFSERIAHFRFTRERRLSLSSYEKNIRERSMRSKLRVESRKTKSEYFMNLQTKTARDKRYKEYVNYVAAL